MQSEIILNNVKFKINYRYIFTRLEHFNTHQNFQKRNDVETNYFD
jgi:hypothetical protein